MGQQDVVAIRDVKCPSCEADALYRYGRIRTGSQRFICLMCGMQFTPSAKKSAPRGKPVCQECGNQL